MAADAGAGAGADSARGRLVIDVWFFQPGLAASYLRGHERHTDANAVVTADHSPNANAEANQSSTLAHVAAFSFADSPQSLAHVAAVANGSALAQPESIAVACTVAVARAFSLTVSSPVTRSC